MAELMVDYITSLDGFGSAEGWPGLWGMGGPEYLDFLAEDARQEFTLLMGAHTYRLFAEFASSGAEDMSDMTRRAKVVFSRSIREPLKWANTTLASGDAVETVRQMKRGDVALRTVGSPSLCRSLLKAGLVDRYRVVIFPVINGATGADRIYDDWPDVTMQVTSLRTLDKRLQLLEAKPTVLDTPPQ